MPTTLYLLSTSEKMKKSSRKEPSDQYISSHLYQNHFSSFTSHRTLKLKLLSWLLFLQTCLQIFAFYRVQSSVHSIKIPFFVTKKAEGLCLETKLPLFSHSKLWNSRFMESRCIHGRYSRNPVFYVIDMFCNSKLRY